MNIFGIQTNLFLQMTLLSNSKIYKNTIQAVIT